MIKGFDVSFWQDDDDTPQLPDFKKARAGGLDFCIMRSHWLYDVDSDFFNFWKLSKEAGLIRGNYIFFDWRSGKDPVYQAEIAVKITEKDPGELPVFLDLEKLFGAYPVRERVLPMIKAFSDRVVSLSGYKPILYTNPDFLVNLLKPIPAWLLEHDLWVANYTSASQPTIGEFKTWKFWQYTSSGDGIKYGMESRGLDLNWFNGTLEELRNYRKHIPTTEERLKALEKFCSEKFGYIPPEIM